VRDKTPAEIERFFQDSARVVSPDATVAESGAEALGGTGRVVTARLRLQAGELGILQGRVMILDLPAYPFPMGEIQLFLGQAARKNPIELGQPAVSRLRMEITLPEGTEILYLPPALEQVAAEWSARRTIRHIPERWLIEVEEEVRVLQRILPVAGYADARAFFSRWLDRSNSLLILRLPVDPGGAPAAAPGGEGR
jgi:hypothetical protein